MSFNSEDESNKKFEYIKLRHNVSAGNTPSPSELFKSNSI